MKKSALKPVFIILALLILILSSFTTSVLAGGQKTYYPTEGTDATGDSSAYLSPTDITWVQSVDSSLVTTSDWPDNTYNESKYVEFDFSGNFTLESDAKITSFKITIIYRTSATTLAAAKMKIYEKKNNAWHEESIGIPTAINVDTSFSTGNLSSYLNTAEDLNNLVVRFYAYDHSTTSISINQVKADFAYEGTVSGVGGAELPTAGSNSAAVVFLLGASFTSLGFYLKKAKVFNRF